MPIASMQTQEGSCTPHWRRLFSALYTVISPGLETGALEHWSTGALDTGHWRQTDSGYSSNAVRG